MPALLPSLVRVGHQGSSRFATVVAKTAQAATTTQRRSTSWIAWEQPDPALYAPPTRAPRSNETQQAASNAQDTRSVGHAVTAPATAAVAGASHQEVSVSGKTVPPTIPAGSSRVLSSQTRSVQTQAGKLGDEGGGGAKRWVLPTTLLRIPKMTSTWPGETPEYPDQKRVRKHHVVVHENEGPSSREPDHTTEETCDTTSSRYDPDGKPTALLSTVSSVLLGLQALKENPESSYSNVSFRQAILTYMDGVQSREEAQAAARDLEDALLVASAPEKEGRASGDEDPDKSSGKERA